MKPGATLPLVCLVCLAAVLPAALRSQTIMVEDDQGHLFQAERPPQRIVSLAPNITEVLFALGLERAIVGVTRYCDFPSRAAGKKKVGGLVDPNIEVVKALVPDLVIAFRGNPLRLVERMRGIGLPVFVLDMGTDLESVLTMIMKLGRVTGQEDRAGALIDGLSSKARSVLHSLEAISHRPQVFLFLHGMGFWTCGGQSYLSDLIEKAGGRNVAASIDRAWINYNREQFVQDDPEAVIILAKKQEDFLAARDWLRSQAPFAAVRALKDDKVHFLAEDPASRFGPRLFDVLLEVARLLHPEIPPRSP